MKSEGNEKYALGELLYSWGSKIFPILRGIVGSLLFFLVIFPLFMLLFFKILVPIFQYIIGIDDNDMMPPTLKRWRGFT